VEVALHGVAHGGEAVGRLEGEAAFAAYGLPGERVLLEVVERKPRYLRGAVREVLEAASERVTAPCPIFGRCGGCHWQHASYEAQLEYKTAILRDQLQRIGRFADPPVEAPIGSPLKWHYRNTVQFVPGVAGPNGRPSPPLRPEVRRARADAGEMTPPGIGPRGVDRRDEVGAGRSAGREPPSERLLCFQRARSHLPVAVEHCYIADELVDRALHDVPWHMLDAALWALLDGIVVRVVPGQAIQITLVAQARLPGAPLRHFAAAARQRVPALRGVLVASSRSGQTWPIWGDDSLAYEVGGYRLDVPAGAFVQVNLGAAELALDRVVEWLGPEPGDSVVDAYAGVGTFALGLGRRAGSVVAIDSHPAAVEAGSRNAAANGLLNVLYERTSVERGLAKLRGGVDLMVLDPPRRGCAPPVLAEIARLRPRRIAYVSCEPSTLARDLQTLAGHGYQLVHTGVVDLFPQTYHLESVSLLERG
jgi:23S rRNA (uracil1939-C5)-methyltransferase